MGQEERDPAERDVIESERMVIEVELGSLWVGGEAGSTLAAHIAGLAAERLLHREEREALIDLRRRYSAIADDEIRAHLRPLIREALEHVATPTDAFGNQRPGEAKTLHEVVVEMARKELTQKRGDSFRGRTATTLVEDFVKAEVEDVLGRELKEVVREAKVDVIAAVREKAAEVIAETIERVAAGRNP